MFRYLCTVSGTVTARCVSNEKLGGVSKVPKMGEIK